MRHSLSAQGYRIIVLWLQQWEQSFFVVCKIFFFSWIIFTAFGKGIQTQSIGFDSFTRLSSGVVLTIWWADNTRYLLLDCIVKSWKSNPSWIVVTGQTTRHERIVCIINVVVHAGSELGRFRRYRNMYVYIATSISSEQICQMCCSQ